MKSGENYRGKLLKLKIKMKLEKIKIKNLKPHPKNPKKHDIEFIKDRIKRLGYKSVIVIDENNVILAGHGRVKALKELNENETYVLRVTDLNEKQKEEYLLGDNQATLLEGMDDDILKKFDKDLLEMMKIDVDKFIEPDEKDDIVPEIPEEPKAKLGDIYQLGKHRIMCGDSTNLEDVEKLMDGKKADMVFTDPPYFMNFTGAINEKGERSSTGKNTLA